MRRVVGRLGWRPQVLAIGLGVLWTVDLPRVTLADVALWCLIAAWPIGFALFVSRMRQVGRRPIVAAIAGGSVYVAALLLEANVAMWLGILVS